MPYATMKTIGISAPPLSAEHRSMFDALGEVFGLRFERRRFGEAGGIDAWIVPAADRDILLRLRRSGLPCYAVIDEALRVDCGASPEVDFSNGPAALPLLGGRRLRSDDAIPLQGLPGWLCDATPLATKGGAPVWTVEGSGPSRIHCVAASIPYLKDGEALFEHFNGDRFLALLPLVTFLRNLAEDGQWQGPPLQACFMFDDPNLHWPTYGYIDFAQLARHAETCGYHVAFGTIPLDAWYVHAATAGLFRSHRKRLSLLVHGNDHTAEELAGRMGDGKRQRFLRQALQRIEGLERRAGLAVSRVMAPPHGACSEETLAAMARVGYEAACISRGSLKHFNPRASWARTVGMRPADIVHGLPVLPRFRLSAGCRNAILIAAFLRQPIIPVGHHQDVAGGLDLLGDLAQYINALGEVRWTDMATIARSNYSWRIEGSHLRLRMHANHIEIAIPEGMRSLAIERPWQEGESAARLLVKLNNGLEARIAGNGEPICVAPGQRATIACLPRFETDRLESSRGLRPWPVIRRLLTETRDRLTPRMRLARQA